MYTTIQLERRPYASEEHQMLMEALDQFIEKEISPNFAQWEKDKMVSREAWLKMGSQGFLCLDTPEEYGGGGMDFSYSALVLERMSYAGYIDIGLAIHSDIIAPYLFKYGTEEQKQRFLPKMARGEWIGCLGMTEPGVGSDLKSLRTTAQDQGDHYLINGSKTFITNGYISDFVLLACRTNPGTEQEGISLVFVESDRPGFSKGKPFEKIGFKANDTCELFFEDVKVPKENLLGQEGRGFQIMMTELARERLTIALQGIGAAEGALEGTLAYTQERKAFKKAIADFQNTQFKLAECATNLQVHQSFVDHCTELEVAHKLSAEQAAMAKLSATEMHSKVVDECLQLHGGYGYMWDYDIARNYAASRVARIYGGSNEIMKLVISRGLFSEYLTEKRAQRKALETA